MTAAAFSADGSVLAVAAETITLWDPENNVLVAVIGEIETLITSLSFAGKSKCLVSVSQGSKPQLSVWSMSKLSVSWSYKFQVEDIACAVDLSVFAALVLLPKGMGSNGRTIQNGDGVILLFNATDPVPVATWSVKKANGGGLAFIQGNRSVRQNVLDGEPSEALLVYINGDHGYVVFDPHGNEVRELSLARRELIALEETGKFGYASIYGQLPEFDLKKTNQHLLTLSGPSVRPWETIFSGSSHSLPPLTKLCSAFLESLLEKRTPIVE